MFFWEFFESLKYRFQKNIFKNRLQSDFRNMNRRNTLTHLLPSSTLALSHLCPSVQRQCAAHPTSTTIQPGARPPSLPPPRRDKPRLPGVGTSPGIGATPRAPGLPSKKNRAVAKPHPSFPFLPRGAIYSPRSPRPLPHGFDPLKRFGLVSCWDCPFLSG
jgi:hypothetical protein